ncbi:hypothetical protein ACUXCC_005620 [Cytobacillus horneckiae]|uniref:hypothetical protein n=1 Tax=Cytobacillus horneckiae TaxID=549687 RepID=UPI000ACBBC08|nr:hypothetical protein [Cytobacillus horneckiae]MCM3181260.1 hypothetical protein [Cytobacillus horneckiae]MEC1155444.1 hypothetical protein [Cytobacillus horneckiae]MED2939533.1 hypothetical protein [Cytobacillus horneckiae]
MQSKAKVKVAATVKTKPKTKTYVAPKTSRGVTVNRVAKNAAKTEKHVVSSDVKVAPKKAPKGGNTQSTEEAESQFLMKLDLQLFAGEKGTSGNNKVSIKVTEEIIREAMKDAPLRTMQNAVSLPAIQRYVDRLAKGDVAPPIRVDKGIIVEGNHRYVAGRVFGQEPAQQSWSGGISSLSMDFKKIKIDPTDWGNR